MLIMTDYIVIAIVLVLAGLAAFYIIKQKKKGAKCIGCPYAKDCSGSCGCDK